jgi:hypothetical protein
MYVTKTPAEKEGFVVLKCKPCTVCGTTKEFTLNDMAVAAWEAGGHIQKVMPDLTQMDRETLISGVCSDKCWDELWGEGFE